MDFRTQELANDAHGRSGSEGRFELLASTAGRLLAAEEPEAAIESLCRDVMDRLDCQLFFNYLASPNGVLQLNACAGVPDAERERIARLDARRTICGEVARNGRSVVAGDLQNSDAPEAALVRSYGVQAYCCHPMTAEGRLLGTLSFGTRTRTRFTAEEVDLMRAVTDQVATTIERGKTRVLKAVNSQLVEMNRRKDELLAALAHELRNPLAAMGSALDVLRLSDDRQAAGEQARRILDRQFGRLVGLVDDLLDVSRITEGKIELRKQRVDLRAVVERAAEGVRPRIEAAGQTLSVRTPAERIDVLADAARIAEAVTNLVGNATKFSARGARIDVLVTAGGDEAQIIVRDTGIGIPAEFVPHVFDVLTQGPNAADTNGGLGIGLTLARSLIRMHGGAIDVRSEGRGRGAEFVVRLPLEAGDARPAGERQEAETGQPARDPRILVVVDDRDAADGLIALLRLLGADASAVYDCPAALEALSAVPHAAVLLDIRMAQMDGHAVARHLREALEDPAPKIVALTEWDQPVDRRRARAAGFDELFVKPIELETLERLVAGLRGEPGAGR